MATKQNETPTFRQPVGLMMDLPTRDEMLAALVGGVEACIYRAEILASGSTTHTIDMGGLPTQAPFVELALRYGAILTRMHEALSPMDGDEAQS